MKAKSPTGSGGGVEAAGKRIEPEAVHLLHMGVGAHPQELANELEKLAIHLSDRKTITRDDVAGSQAPSGERLSLNWPTRSDADSPALPWRA